MTTFDPAHHQLMKALTQEMNRVTIQLLDAHDAANTAHQIAEEADTRLAAVRERYDATAGRLLTLLQGGQPAAATPDPEPEGTP